MKKKGEGWFPRTRPNQLVMFTNMKAKIGGYEGVLPFPKVKIDRVVLICDIFTSAFNFVEQSRATMQNLTDWQDLVFTAEGGTKGDPAPAAPAFQTLVLPSGAFIGIFDEFRELVEDIKGADGYTQGIGEDLMIVPAESAEVVESELVADIKVQALAGNKVRISGSLQGMDAIQVQYQPKGAGAAQTFFLTKLPAEITVAVAAAGQPENGFVRGVLIKNNNQVGQYSPDFPVTIS